MPSRFLLDTNIISDLIRNPGGSAANRVRQRPNEILATSIVVASELRYGGVKKGSLKLLRQIEAVLSGMEILPFDVASDVEYGNLRVRLESAGRPIGPNDLFIAAHALTHKMILVTANEREFAKIPGLTVENWL